MLQLTLAETMSTVALEQLVVQVATPAGFPAALCRLLRDDAARQALGARARQVIADNQGATRRTLELVEDLLGAAPVGR